MERAVVVGHSMGAFVAARVAATHPEQIRALVLVDGGVPLPLPAGATPVEDLATRIPLSWGRLGRRFASPEDYLAYWRSDPSAYPDWAPAVEAALLADLREGADGCWTPAVVRAAVEADGSELYDPAGSHLLEGPATYLVPAVGGLHAPGTVSATVGPAVDVRVVERVDHDGIVLDPVGAAAVARSVLDGAVT